MMSTSQRKFRTAQADRMGFAWEAHELPDMTIEDARRIIAEDDLARSHSTIGNEDTITMEYARALIARYEEGRLS